LNNSNIFELDSPNEFKYIYIQIFLCDENTKTNFTLKNGNNTFNETINNDSNQFIYELTNKTIELNISESKPFFYQI